MPVYQYQCPTCGSAKERNLPVDERDSGAPNCDEPDCCDLMPMTRKWGVAGVIIR